MPNVNLETSKRVLGDMMKYPSNQFEAFADTYRFISENIPVEKQILFLLRQELLHAQNIRINKIINPAAIKGLVPFSGGRINTALDSTLLPGLDPQALGNNRQTSALQGYNVGQLEANYEQTSSPVEGAKQVLKSLINQLIGGSVNKSDSSSKRGKSIEEYLKVNENIIKNPSNLDIRKRNEYLENNKTYISEQQKQNIQQQFPFYFKSLNYSASSERKYIYFQGIINSLGESFNPSWNSEDVFGRPHPIWIYSNVSRMISMEFLIVTNSYNDINRARQRVDWLAKHTYPELTRNGNEYINFLSGPLISITIGDLFKDLNGFISSLDFDWNFIKRWDLTRRSVFPQGVKVNIKFNVLEKEIISNTDDSQINIYTPFGE